MPVVETHFPGLTENQRRQFAGLEGLYNEWNAKINVISRKDMEHFYVHHVLHSWPLPVMQTRSRVVVSWM